MGRKKGEDNLIPLTQRSKEEQMAIRSAGGKASSQKRREKRKMIELLELAFGRQIENKITGEKRSAKDVTAIKLVDECVKGNLKAISLAMELLGERSRTVELTGKDGKDIFDKFTDTELMAQYEEMKRKLD